MDIAEYGRLNDRNTVSWRFYSEIIGRTVKQDISYLNEIDEDKE